VDVLFVLIPTAWLAITVMIMAACRMAGLADAAERNVAANLVVPGSLGKARLARVRFRADMHRASARTALAGRRSRDHIGPFTGRALNPGPRR
jgi:hypothetical protein